MSSLLRLPTFDRPSLGLSKRSSLLSTPTASSMEDDFDAGLTSLGTLPSVEHLDNDDFLNMFEGSGPSNRDTDRPRPSTGGLPVELSSTSLKSRLSELPAISAVRSVKVATSRPKPVMDRQEAPVHPRRPQMSYRSSMSSSNPSTKGSNASSRRTRASSVSSAAEDISSSERSLKELDKENVIQQRQRQKRVSFGHTQMMLGPQGPSPKRRRSVSEADLPEKSIKVQSKGCVFAQETIGANTGCSRPLSRGKRLGKAMSDGIPISPPPTPRQTSDIRRWSRGLVSPKESTDNPSRSSSTTTRPHFNPVADLPKLEGFDQIRIGIMSSLDSILDLKSLALVSKDFYRTFQKFETLLVDAVLFRQSRGAWELRYSVRKREKPSPFRLKSVLRDYSTINALEDFIVWRCESTLRPQSLDAFLGHNLRRKAELENALWLIWTFCNDFGKTSMSDATLLKQTLWLDGKPKRQSRASLSPDPGRTPCSTKELEDMSEMWRCLEMLLSGFKNREEEARQAGLFDNVGERKSSDRELVDLWIYDILSLGPKAVLTLSSCDFEQAKVLGITRWTPPASGKSRSNFLKAALEEVYRDRLMKQAKKKALAYRHSVQHNHKRSWSDPTFVDPKPKSTPPIPRLPNDDLNMATHTLPRKPTPSQVLIREIRPDCDPLSPAETPVPVFSPASNPGVFSPLVMTKNASTKLGATLFPIQNRDQSHRLSIPLQPDFQDQEQEGRRSMAEVIDPTDKAVALMVQEMGYGEAEAKRALALSDTGSGVDVQKAIALLSSDDYTPEPSKKATFSELPAATGEARLTRKPSLIELCEGHCKPIMLVEPKRERVSGLGIVKRRLSYRMSFRRNTSTKLSVIPDEEESTSSSRVGTARDSVASSSKLTKRASNLSALAAPTSLAGSSPSPPKTLDIPQPHRQCAPPALPGLSPVSPVTPPCKDWQDWLRFGNNPVATAHAHLEGSRPKPRVTLQRVGTGMKKRTWTIPGRKKKEKIIQPEIIGYAY